MKITLSFVHNEIILPQTYVSGPLRKISATEKFILMASIHHPSLLVDDLRKFHHYIHSSIIILVKRPLLSLFNTMLYFKSFYQIVLATLWLLARPATSSASCLSPWAVSIGSRVERALTSPRKEQPLARRRDYRGGAAVAAVKTMTGRQMEAFK